MSLDPGNYIVSLRKAPPPKPPPEPEHSFWIAATAAGVLIAVVILSAT